MYVLGSEYSLEANQWEASNEYLQHMFLWRNNNMYLSTSIILSYGTEEENQYFFVNTLHAG